MADATYQNPNHRRIVYSSTVKTRKTGVSTLNMLYPQIPGDKPAAGAASGTLSALRRTPGQETYIFKTRTTPKMRKSESATLPEKTQ